jgi:hypothetical protein
MLTCRHSWLWAAFSSQRPLLVFVAALFLVLHFCQGRDKSREPKVCVLSVYVLQIKSREAGFREAGWFMDENGTGMNEWNGKGRKCGR